MDNMFLCGIFPGPSKPKKWRPMLNLIATDILKLHSGIPILDCVDNQQKVIHGTLISVVADMEARKIV